MKFSRNSKSYNKLRHLYRHLYWNEFFHINDPIVHKTCRVNCETFTCETAKCLTFLCKTVKYLSDIFIDWLLNVFLPLFWFKWLMEIFILFWHLHFAIVSIWSAIVYQHLQMLVSEITSIVSRVEHTNSLTSSNSIKKTSGRNTLSSS